jgi:hypothetical protein
MRVSRFLTGAEAGVKSDVANWLEVNSRVNALEEKLVDKARADDRGSGRGHITEVVMVNVEVEPVLRLKMNCKVTVTYSSARLNSVRGYALGRVGYQGVVHREQALIGDLVLEE